MVLLNEIEKEALQVLVLAGELEDGHARGRGGQADRIGGGRAGLAGGVVNEPDRDPGGRTVLDSSHLLSEVAQTVDDVVVVSRGRFVAQATLAELTARTSVIRARTPDASRLREVLRAAGIPVRLVDHSTVEARSATADAVGLAAAAAGLPIFELSRHDEDLESLFFDLVQQNHQNQEIAA